MNALSFQRPTTITLLAFSIAVLATLFPSRVTSQLIGIKSVPVATGDQFLIYPSANLALGGVSIAMNDLLLDPFSNPAKGARLGETLIVGSPTFYSISDHNGAGRTIPITFLAGSDSWFGGGSFALQQLIAADRWNWWGPNTELRDRSARNLYLHGFFGRMLGESGFSLGGSLSWAGLGALDGVEHLYAFSERIEQDGHSVDLRLGLLGEWESGQSFEVLLLHNRFDMTHEVHYLDWIWQQDWEIGEEVPRMERNLDQTNTSGLHLGFTQPLTRSGWCFGVATTVNRKLHPKIPNYEIQNIPRDPGDSWAYDFGVGIAKTGERATYGIDLVLEPISSYTWADAASDTVGSTGNLVRAGEKTVENEFSFLNAKIRMGIGHNFGWGGFQLGLQMRSIRYDLTQTSHIKGSTRNQRESWMEWTPSWGLHFGLAEFDLRYRGRLITGTGRPGVARARIGMAEPAAEADFLPAPEGPLTLRDAWVMTHQISVSMPIR